MKKLTKAELAKLEKKSGVQVRRKMGAQPKAQVEAEVPPANEVAKPEKQVEKTQPHASMAASMAAHEKEMRRIENSIDAKFAEIRAQLVTEAKRSKGTEYTFDMVRGDNQLLKRVYARPGIIDD